MDTSFLRGKRLFLLDMDGTVYLGDRLFDGTVAFLDYVRTIGGKTLFLTNNSSRSVQAYIEKMQRLGIRTQREDYLTSVDALIDDLKRNGFQNTRIYALGTASFRAQLTDAGFSLTDVPGDDVGLLVCGFDTELVYQKLVDACRLLDRGVPFLAANPDWTCPTEFGYIPDCGSICEMLRRATGRSPRFIGKPEPAMALLAMQRCGFSPEQTVLVGDRVYTDIACGVHAGIDSVLVLSGEATERDAENSPERPTAILSDIRALLGALQKENGA